MTGQAFAAKDSSEYQSPARAEGCPGPVAAARQGGVSDFAG